jgi:anti-anti-sigma factor
MRISTDFHNDDAILTLAGDIDGRGADGLAIELDKAQHSCPGRVVLDFGQVDMITSAGLGTIIMSYKRLTATGRTLELRDLKPSVRQVFLMTGLDKLLDIGDQPDPAPTDGDSRAKDLASAERAMRNARRFLSELLKNLGIEPDRAGQALRDIFAICPAVPDHAMLDANSSNIRAMLAELDLQRRLAKSLKNRPAQMHSRIKPYTVGMNSLLQVRCGNGLLGETFDNDTMKQVQLIDVVDHNETSLPFMLYDGLNIPLDDKSFDITLLNCALNRCEDPGLALAEIVRVTRKRIIAIESIHLNETQRQFNMFFDWLFNEVLAGAGHLGHNFKKHDEWRWFFRDAGLAVRANVDMGLDQATCPEYHWMYVLDVPEE